MSRTTVKIRNAARLLSCALPLVCGVWMPVAAARAASAQSLLLVPTVVKAAGTGAGYYSGDFGPASFVALNLPSAVAFDSAGSYYVTDTGNNCIRRIDASTNAVTVVAGLTSSGGDTCNSAANPNPVYTQGLLNPLGIAIDSLDNIYVADSGHNCVRMLPHGTTGLANMTTVAGSCTASNTATTTTFGSATPRPAALVVDSNNTLYISISDHPNGVYQVLRHTSGASALSICRVSGANGTVSTTPCAGYSTFPVLNSPAGLSIDPIGRLFVADTGNNCIRMVQSATSPASTGLGTCANDGTTSGSAAITAPTGLQFTPQGELYFTSTLIHQLFRANLGTQSILRMAGSPSGAAGSYDQLQNGIGSQSIPLSSPAGMALSSSGDILLVETGNSIVRRLSMSANFGTQSVGSSSGAQLLTFSINAANVDLSYSIGPDYTVTSNTCTGALTGAAAGELSKYCTLTVSFKPTLPGKRYSSLVLIDQANSSQVWTGLTGLGTGSQGVWLPGTALTTATNLPNVRASAADSAGNVYVLTSDGTNAGTVIYTIAPGGTPVASTAGIASLVDPTGIAVDAAGNLYVSDRQLGKVVQIGATVNTNYLGGLTSPVAVAIDAQNSLYVAEGGTKHDIVKFYLGGETAVIAGAGASASNNIPAVSAALQSPAGLAVTPGGNLYVADSAAHRVYVIDKDQQIHYFAGNGTTTTSQADAALGLGLQSPSGVMADAAEDLFIVDSSANKVYVVYSSTLNMKNAGVVLGTGTAGNTGDGSAATSAQVSAPNSLALTSDGTIYVTDSGNNSLRSISFAAPTIDLGTVPVGSTGSTAVTIWNRGNSEMLRTGDPTFSNLTPTSLTSNPFANYGTLSTCGLSIAAGVICDFGFSFSPTTDGSAAIDASLQDTAYNAPQVVHLKADTGAPRIISFVGLPETEIYGQPYTGSTSITTSINAVSAPTGTLTYKVGAVTLCSFTGDVINTVNCTAPSSTLAPGTYTVSIDYSGDGTFVAQHTTAVLTVTKGKLIVTVGNQSKSQGTPNPTFTGTISGAAPTDTVTANYTSTATTTSPAGTYPITATLTISPASSAAYYDVTNTPGVMTVTSTTGLALGSNLNPSYVAQPVTFTATLDQSGATGAISFFDGTTLLCSSVAANAGSAICTVSSLALGTHTITASFVPSSSNFSTASAQLVQYVAVPTGSFTISVTPVSQYIIGPGDTKYPITVTSVGNFDGTVKLSCSGLPADATCTIDTPQIVLTPGQSVTTMLTTTTSNSDATLVRPAKPVQDSNLGPLYIATSIPMGLSSFGVLLAGIRRRRSASRLFLALFLALGAIGLAGCGCVVNSVKAYSVKVTGTSIYGGPADVSTTVELSVASPGR